MEKVKTNNLESIKDIEGNFFTNIPLKRLEEEALSHIAIWNKLSSRPGLLWVAQQKIRYWQHVVDQVHNYKFWI